MDFGSAIGLKEDRRLLQEIEAMRLRGTSWSTVCDVVEASWPGLQESQVREIFNQYRLAKLVAVDPVLKRQQELQRLDALQEGHWALAVAGDPKSAAIVLNAIKLRIALEGLDQRQQDQNTVAAQVLVVGSDSAEWLAALRAGREGIPLEEARKAIESNAEGPDKTVG